MRTALLCIGILFVLASAQAAEANAVKPPRPPEDYEPLTPKTSRKKAPPAKVDPEPEPETEKQNVAAKRDLADPEGPALRVRILKIAPSSQRFVTLDVQMENGSRSNISVGSVSLLFYEDERTYLGKCEVQVRELDAGQTKVFDALFEISEADRKRIKAVKLQLNPLMNEKFHKVKLKAELVD